MTMSTTTLITSKHRKGRHAIRLAEVAYDQTRLDGDRAQMLNERGGEWQSGIAKLIAELTTSNRYANEEVRSSYIYPPEYRAPKHISQQVDALAGLFGLSLGYTSEWIDKILPTLTLPEGAEGWFAIPSIDALAKRHFPEVENPAERYTRAVALILEKIAASRSFHNYRAGQITPERLRMHIRTAEALAQIGQTQQGDIIILPAQLGLRHRGRSTRRAREVFVNGEFGFGSLMGGAVTLTHPERFVRWEQLHMDLPGDEFDDQAADARFDHAPIFHCNDGEVKVGANPVGHARERYGSGSAFLPQ
jgi:hypothetical protein